MLPMSAKPKPAKESNTAGIKSGGKESANIQHGTEPPAHIAPKPIDISEAKKEKFSLRLLFSLFFVLIFFLSIRELYSFIFLNV